MTRWFALVPALLVLCVCSPSQPVRLAQAGIVAPSGPDRLAAFQVHPLEWWTILSKIEAEEDARLAGCFDPIGDDLADQSPDSACWRRPQNSSAYRWGNRVLELALPALKLVAGIKVFASRQSSSRCASRGGSRRQSSMQSCTEKWHGRQWT